MKYTNAFCKQALSLMRERSLVRDHPDVVELMIALEERLKRPEVTDEMMGSAWALYCEECLYGDIDPNSMRRILENVLAMLYPEADDA